MIAHKTGQILPISICMSCPMFFKMNGYLIERSQTDDKILVSLTYLKVIWLKIFNL